MGKKPQQLQHKGVINARRMALEIGYNGRFLACERQDKG